MRETNNRYKEIELEIRKMKKEWIDMYEKVIRLINEEKATDYEKDQEHDND